MSEKLKTTAVMILNDNAREFLRVTNFHSEIPEEATSIVFFEDGECMFMHENIPGLATFRDPGYKFLRITYTTTPLEVELV